MHRAEEGKVTSIAKVLLLFSLQHNQIENRGTINAKHRSFSEDSVLEFKEPVGSNALSSVLRIGVDNQIPLGIVLGGGQLDDLCDLNVEWPAGTTTLRRFVSMINRDMPRYQASWRMGVLVLEPVSLSRDVEQLLGLQLKSFSSPPENFAILGSNLWMNIRSTISPTQGTIGGGFSSTMSETLPEVKMMNKSVESALNTIVNQGSGAVWILHGAEVKNLEATTQQPYRIYGYVGESEMIKSRLGCSK